MYEIEALPEAIKRFLKKRRNKNTFLTKNPKYVGREGWWYTGGHLPNYSGKIYGEAVAGFYTVHKGRRYYSYIIETDFGLRRAEFPLGR